MDRIVEKPIEVIKYEILEKIVEKIVEVEKIIYKEAEESCDCLTGVRFIDTWNKLLKIKGEVSTDCITQKQFISLVRDSVNSNAIGCIKEVEDTFKKSRNVNSMFDVDQRTSNTQIQRNSIGAKSLGSSPSK